jgi:hypothetical protein
MIASGRNLLSFCCELVAEVSGYAVSSTWAAHVEPADPDRTVGAVAAFPELRICLSTTGRPHSTPNVNAYRAALAPAALRSNWAGGPARRAFASTADSSRISISPAAIPSRARRTRSAGSLSRRSGNTIPDPRA